MRHTSLMPSAQVAYSDLLAAVLTATVPDRGISYFTRRVNNRDYWYLQHVVGSDKRSLYLGPDTAEWRRLIDRCKQRQDEDRPARTSRKQMVAVCAASGLHTLTATEGRVYEVLAQAGLFAAGAVVVGTHAFLHIGNMLCVRWEKPAAQTLDIDIAHSQSISIASPDDEGIQGILDEAGMGVLPVPALNAKHSSTRFRLRNRDVTVSLLTPMLGKPSGKPVLLSGLNAAAEPVRYLDYLLDNSQPAAVPISDGLLVRAPDPARFALHKLAVSQRRQAAFAAKSRKDIAQAAAVLEVLSDLRPGDVIAAGESARLQGERFVNQILVAAKRLDDGLGMLVREAVETPQQAVPKPGGS